MDDNRGTTRTERTVRPNETCPSCGEALHVEPAGRFEEVGLILVWMKCGCLKWRVKEIVFEQRIPDKPK